MIDGGEIAEPHDQPGGFDRGCVAALRRALRLRSGDEAGIPIPVWKQGKKGVFQAVGSGLLLQFFRCSLGQDRAVMHGDQMLEPLGFGHIGGGGDDGHPGAPSLDAGDQLPELAAGEGIDTGGRLVEDQQIRVMYQRAAERQFLFHAAGKLLRRPVAERGKPGGLQQFLRPLPPLALGLVVKPGEEVEILGDGECGVEVLAKALRHIGDAAANTAPVIPAPQIAAEQFHRSVLDPLGAGEQCQQG